MNKYQSGDIVKVINRGCFYPCYGSWFKEHAPGLLDRYNQTTPDNGSIGKVVTYGRHSRDKTMLYVVDFGGDIKLVSHAGIELVNRDVGPRITDVWYKEFSDLHGWNKVKTDAAHKDLGSCKKEPRFKVGDRVKYTGNDTPFLIGDTGIIKSFESNRGVVVSWNNNKNAQCGVFASNLTKVEEPEIINFKITAQGLKNTATKRKWSDSEVMLARYLSRELVGDLFERREYITFSLRLRDMTIILKTGFSSNAIIKKTTATPSPNDEFNEWIGKCVCLCKLTKTPIPDFISGSGK